MPQVAVFITHRALPGRRDDVRRTWEDHMRPAIAANPAHAAYFYCLDGSDPDVIRAFQVYDDAAAARDFLQTAAYAAYVQAVDPLLTGPPEVSTAAVAWSLRSRARCSSRVRDCSSTRPAFRS